MRYVEYRAPPALEQIGRIHAIPVKRHDQKLIRHLTMEEVRAILNAPDLRDALGVRDRAMMHLCFAGGLRVSELVGVLTENLSLQHGASVTIRGKGRQRALPAALEGDGAGSPRLGERQGRSPCAGALRQCTG